MVSMNEKIFKRNEVRKYLAIHDTFNLKFMSDDIENLYRDKFITKTEHDRINSMIANDNRLIESLSIAISNPERADRTVINGMEVLIHC